VRALQVAAQAVAAFPGHRQSSAAALPAVSFFYDFMIQGAWTLAKMRAGNCRQVSTALLEIMQVSRLILAPRVINNPVYIFPSVRGRQFDTKGYKYK
jgi:hypothetical protein